MQHHKANFESMDTLSSLIGSVVKKGYTENFSVNEYGLYAPSVDKHYHADKVVIDNFYRFEGASDPSDNTILYTLQTNDGIKGSLLDSYGADANDQITDFIRNVQEMHKIEAKANKH